MLEFGIHLTGVYLSDYKGEYELYATLHSGDVGSAYLTGSYVDSEGLTYDLASEAQVLTFSAQQVPELAIEGWPGFHVEYTAVVPEWDIDVAVVADSQVDMAYMEYNGSLVYKSQGIVSVEVFGEQLVMDTTLRYDEPGELVGYSYISLGIYLPSEEGAP